MTVCESGVKAGRPARSDWTDAADSFRGGRSLKVRTIRATSRIVRGPAGCPRTSFFYLFKGIVIVAKVTPGEFIRQETTIGDVRFFRCSFISV